MNIKQAREQFTVSHKCLREARREYIVANRHRVLVSDGFETINQVAKEMLDAGLYAPTQHPNWRDMRYHIVRAIWRHECKVFGKDRVGEWHFWIPRNGFNWNFGKSKQAIA